MTFKPRSWQIVLAIAAVCTAAIAGIVWFRSRALTPVALLSRMPAADSLVVYIDFNALRQAGVLQLLEGIKVGVDPEYRAFVSRTRFDYQRDLDNAMVAFSPTGTFIFARGRFDWNSLRSYVEAGNGKCYDALCRIAGSGPARHISFFPLRSSLMALAVSPDDSAALRLNVTSPAPGFELPDAPVWLSIPASLLRTGENLPSGTRRFARIMEQAETVTLAFAPEGNRLAARLNVRCRTDRDAAAVASQLSDTTRMLLEMIEREHQKPNPADLSGVLTSGEFRSDGPRVLGHWPIERTFVENMLGGQ